MQVSPQLPEWGQGQRRLQCGVKLPVKRRLRRRRRAVARGPVVQVKLEPWHPRCVGRGIVDLDLERIARKNRGRDEEACERNRGASSPRARVSHGNESLDSTSFEPPALLHLAKTPIRPHVSHCDLDLGRARPRTARRSTLGVLRCRPAPCRPLAKDHSAVSITVGSPSRTDEARQGALDHPRCGAGESPWPNGDDCARC